MKPDVSVIVPLCNEENNVKPLLEGIRQSLDGENRPYEIILVDDGSSDGTYTVIQEEASGDERIVGIRFRRTFGQTAAIKAGFSEAGGRICITMDGDLQHDPAQIPEFLRKIEEGYDLVCGYRHERDDQFLRRFPSKVANWLAGKLTRARLQDFGSTYRAYRTDLARQMPIYGEMHRFIPVFAGMMTNRITEIPITLKPRLHGASKYGLDRALRVLSDLLLLFFAGFFSRPIHIFGYLSLILGLPGFSILGWLAMRKIFFGIAIMQYGPLFFLGVMLCLVAVQIMTTGIVCEYLIRIYYSDGERKPYSVAETTRSGDNE